MSLRLCALTDRVLYRWHLLPNRDGGINYRTLQPVTHCLLSCVGGYSYRLCPADSPLTEACFQKHPLAFAGQASLRWGGVGGEQLFFNATDVSGDLVVPAGSTWRKCPIPRGPWGWIYNGPSFEPVCEESEACKALVNTQHSPGAYSVTGSYALPSLFHGNCLSKC